MTRSFDCPKCGAPVSFAPTDPFSPQTSVRCTYCNSLLALPNERSGQPARVISQVTVRLGSGSGKAPKWLWLILIIPLLGILIGVVAMLGALAPVVHLLGSGNKSQPTSSPGSKGFGG